MPKNSSNPLPSAGTPQSKPSPFCYCEITQNNLKLISIVEGLWTTHLYLSLKPSMG